MKINEILTEAVRQRLDPECWKGKHKEGTKIKGGVRVNNCVPNEGVAEGSEWETRHDEFTTVGDRATPEQINKIVSALGVAAKQASSKRGFLNQIVGRQSNGDLARMAHGAETLAKNIQRNSNAKPGTDKRKELGQHLVYAVSLLKRMNGQQGVAEGAENLNYIGNCTQDDVIEHIFGDATGFAQAVDEYGDEFTLDDLVVKYDPETDVHSFYYKEQGVAEGSNKNVVKSVKVGNFRHDLVDTGFGWQVRIYNGDDLYDTGLSKNSEQKGLVALDDAVAHTKKQLNIKDQGVAEELGEEFDLIENIIENLAKNNGVDAETIWEDLESLSDDELYVFATTTTITESEAWQKANKKDKTDGMSQKAVNSYRRAHPGSKLKTAVTTKPGKLKKGSKASKRRKSYCSRSRGQMKMHSISCAKTPDKAICKARRRWNC